MSFAVRLVLLGLAGVGLILLIAARTLEPDPRGFGTHEQLGFSPCVFQSWTGRPCPTCGATTAWAHTLRGNLAQAAACNLAGVLSCAVAVVGVPWLLLAVALGHWPIVRPELRQLLLLATTWFALMILDWLRRWFFN
ncbi:MAG: DUF2752 domain-containing protein [Planctomycetales bacterium]|nr:DUF2752 domain-containing protein [Planctomycetales bacterium]